MKSEGDDLDVTPGRGPRKPVLAARRVQVLALSGGGYRGLYSAHLLANIEQHFKGTSTRTLISLADETWNDVETDQRLRRFFATTRVR